MTDELPDYLIDSSEWVIADDVDIPLYDPAELKLVVIPVSILLVEKE